MCYFLKDMIRNEEHRRLNMDPARPMKDDSALAKLSLDEFLHLRKNYKVGACYSRVSRQSGI